MKKWDKIQEIRGRKFFFKVETSANIRDYKKYEGLRYDIWQDPDDRLPGMRNMKCENFFHEGSSLFIAVYVENSQGRFKGDREHFVGFSYGFVGVKDKNLGFRDPENLSFYSQYVGVRKDYQHYSLGIMIKKFQREKLMEIFGIYTSTSTYDPLTGVNAYRNIHYFGMDVVEYRESCYVNFSGLLNRDDIPLDRFFVSWDLRRKKTRSEYKLESLLDPAHLVVRSELVEIKGRSGHLQLEVIREVNLDLDSELLLVEIPFDFYLMLRETNVPEKEIRNIPYDWRIKTRYVFQTLFRRGYKIVDFNYIQRGKRKRDFYILKK